MNLNIHSYIYPLIHSVKWRPFLEGEDTIPQKLVLCCQHWIVAWNCSESKRVMGAEWYRIICLAFRAFLDCLPMKSWAKVGWHNCRNDNNDRLVAVVSMITCCTEVPPNTSCFAARRNDRLKNPSNFLQRENQHLFSNTSKERKTEFRECQLVFLSSPL